MPGDDGQPGGRSVEQGAIDGLYRWAAAPAGEGPEATLVFSGTAWAAATQARDVLAEHYGVRASLWSATSHQRLRMEALEVERWNRLHPLEQPRVPLVTELLAESAGPVVAVTDFMRAVPDQVSRWVPAGRSYLSLGTDGFGRSDTREALRRFFETDAAHLVVGVLNELASRGAVEPAAAADAIARFGLDPEAPPSWTR